MESERVWSKFHGNIVWVCDCRREFNQDINSLWHCRKTGDYFADYCMSGITPITYRLARIMFNRTLQDGISYNQNFKQILQGGIV